MKIAVVSHRYCYSFIITIRKGQRSIRETNKYLFCIYVQVEHIKTGFFKDLHTLESGIDVGPGKFVKKNKRRALNKQKV